jgi:hypothetical protein
MVHGHVTFIVSCASLLRGQLIASYCGQTRLRPGQTQGKRACGL